jgi:hypothetical protein
VNGLKRKIEQLLMDREAIGVKTLAEAAIGELTTRFIEPKLDPTKPPHQKLRFFFTLFLFALHFSICSLQAIAMFLDNRVKSRVVFVGDVLSTRMTIPNMTRCIAALLIKSKVWL